MSLCSLTCDIEIDHEGNEWIAIVSSLPLALCTTIDKAKELAQTFSDTPFDWRQLEGDKSVEGPYVVDVNIEGSDGAFKTPVRITSFWIWPNEELDCILKADWPYAFHNHRPERVNDPT